MTPPPVKQQEYQSIQKLTLASNQQNGHHEGQGMTNESQHPAQQQATQKQAAAQPRSPKAQGQGAAPSQTVKSSTVLVLK